MIYWLVMGEFMSDYMFFSSHRPVSKIEIDQAIKRYLLSDKDRILIYTMA